MNADARRVVRAGAVAAVLSGVPSTTWALVRRQDPLAATRAAGTLVPGRRPSIVRGAIAHLVVSALWTAVFAVAGVRGAPRGAAAGAAIAGLDLVVIAPRWFPAAAALPLGPQVADHLAFGALLAHGLRPTPDA